MYVVPSYVRCFIFCPSIPIYTFKVVMCKRWTCVPQVFEACLGLKNFEFIEDIFGHVSGILYTLGTHTRLACNGVCASADYHIQSNSKRGKSDVQTFSTTFFFQDLFLASSFNRSF